MSDIKGLQSGIQKEFVVIGMRDMFKGCTSLLKK